MELRILLNALKRKEFAFPIAFLLFLLIFGIIMLINDLANRPKSIEEAKKFGCVLEYGQWQCIEGKIAIPFYNPGPKDITLARVSIPVTKGLNIYEANDLLHSNEAGSLITANCEEAFMEKANLQWCCSGMCFISDFKSPNLNISIKVDSRQ
ncbi:MAG: hypothetical protein QXM75_01795 [Candidatus Diapherotrites archaeon]